MNDQLAIINKRSPEVKEEASKAATLADKSRLLVQEKRITNAMRCLTRLIQNSEREGTFGLTSHRSFALGTPLNNVSITNSYNYEANKGYQKEFKLKLVSSMNIY